MRPEAVRREAARNILGGTSRTLVLALCFGVLLTGLILGSALETRAVIAQADHFRDAGAATTVIAAAGAVDGARCAALASMPGIEAAGALRRGSEPLVAAALPSAPISLYTVTPGFPAVLGAAETAAPGIVLARSAADALGLRPGDAVATASGPVPVAGTYAYPDDGRTAGYGYAAFAPALADAPRGDRFDECWIRAWPVPTAIRSLALWTTEPTADSPTIGQLNPRLGATFAADELLAARILLWAPLIGAVLGAALAAALTRLRRVEYASALHIGVRRRDLLAIHGWETLAWCVPVVALCLGAMSVSGVGLSGADAAAIAADAAVTVLCTLLAAIAASALTLLRVREDRLAHYVRER